MKTALILVALLWFLLPGPALAGSYTITTTAQQDADLQATADAHKKLVFVEAFSEGQLIDTVGQKITYVPKITLATA